MKQRSWGFRVVALAIGLLGWSEVSSATTVLKVPLEEMARRADLVVRGTVREVQVASDPEGMPTHTVVVMEVAEVMKGQPSAPVLRLELLGGANDRGFRKVHGMPGFLAGEEVVLLLERTSTGWVPMGLGEGKFTVRRDLGDVPRAVRRVDLLRMVPDSIGRPMPLEGPSLDDDLTLDELRTTILRARGKTTGGIR